MKRIALFLTVGFSYFLVSACGNQDNRTDDTKRMDSELMHDHNDSLTSPYTDMEKRDSMRIDSLSDTLEFDNKL